MIIVMWYRALQQTKVLFATNPQAGCTSQGNTSIWWIFRRNKLTDKSGVADARCESDGQRSPAVTVLSVIELLTRNRITSQNSTNELYRLVQIYQATLNGLTWQRSI